MSTKFGRIPANASTSASTHNINIYEAIYSEQALYDNAKI